MFALLKRLLSCKNLGSSLFWDVTQRSLLVSCRRFGKQYRSPAWPLKMGLIDCPEASVRSYETTLLNVQEKQRSHLCCGESLQSRRCLFLWTKTFHW